MRNYSKSSVTYKYTRHFNPRMDITATSIQQLYQKLKQDMPSLTYIDL